MSSMRFPRALHALSLSFLALAVAGCGDSTGPGKGVKLTPELVRLNGSSGGASGSLAGHVLSLAVEGPGTTAAAIATSDVDIMSLRMPITEIMIGSDESERVATAYRCTVDDCHVDLAAANFESNLLQSSSVTVPVGTYTWVQFGFCTNDRDSHDVYLTASVNMDGTVYYTRPDGSLSTESPAQAAKITMSGCAIRSEMPHAVIVEDNGVVQAAPEDEQVEGEEEVVPVGDAALRLYFTTEDMAWAVMGATHGLWFPGWCALPLADAEAGTPYICVGYPVVAAFLGRETIPDVERYSTNIATSLTLFTDGSAIYGGYLRRFLRSVSDLDGHHLSATGALFGVSTNSDGSLYINGFVQSFGPEWAFPAFRRESHSGTYRNHDQIDRPYSATRLQ